jgi:prevent-host-death family protein
MTTISARDLQKNIKGCLHRSQRDRIVVTRRGKPTAVIVGVEGMDWEKVILNTDPSFWRLIHTRRKQSTMSLEAFKEKMRD